MPSPAGNHNCPNTFGGQVSVLTTATCHPLRGTTVVATGAAQIGCKLGILLALPYREPQSLQRRWLEQDSRLLFVLSPSPTGKRKRRNAQEQDPTRKEELTCHPLWGSENVAILVILHRLRAVPLLAIPHGEP